MRFTVVTPVLNGLPWLQECVESVAAQRPADVRHLILDPGSTDGTREWLVAKQKLYGYETIFEPDRGQTDALINGFERADGDILSWLNADDRLEVGALSRVERAFNDDEAAILVSGCCILIDGDGAFTGMMVPPAADTYDGLRTEVGNPPQPATFFRHDAYRAAGGLDRGYDLAMDVDLWLKLARIGRLKYLRQDVLARFRVHPTAKSVVDLTGALREDFAIRRRHGLPLRSPAGAWFIRHAFVGPWLRPIKRRVTASVFGADR